MSVYGSGQYLQPNQIYVVKLNIPGVEPYTFKFTSRYQPLYSSAKVVRSDCGGLLDELSDDDIWFAIWLTSKNAEDLLVRKGLIEAAATPEEQTQAIAELLHSDRSLRYAFSQYVRYRTAVDLIRAAYLGIAGQTGQIQKKLGDMSVLRERRIPSLDDMLKGLQREADEWEARLTPSRNRVVTVVRAGASQYPISERRSF